MLPVATCGLHWRLNRKESACMEETRVQSLDREDPLEKEMATHSSIPAWEILWTEEPGKATVCGVPKESDMT